MSEAILVKNDKISPKVGDHRSIYKKFGKIQFELKPAEYKSLRELIVHYKSASKEPGFDYKAWLEEAGKQGLISDEKAFSVYCFLLTEWKSSTNVSAKQNEQNIIVEIVNCENI